MKASRSVCDSPPAKLAGANSLSGAPFNSSSAFAQIIQGEHYLFVNDMIRRQTGDHPETVLQYGLVNAGHNLPVFPLTNR